MATLGLKEMGKFLWEGREKSLPNWLSPFQGWTPCLYPSKPVVKLWTAYEASCTCFQPKKHHLGSKMFDKPKTHQ